MYNKNKADETPEKIFLTIVFLFGTHVCSDISERNYCKINNDVTRIALQEEWYLWI